MSESTLQILLVDDDPSRVKKINSTFDEIHGAQFKIETLTNGEQLPERLAQNSCDVVLVSSLFNNNSGITQVSAWQQSAPKAPFIVVIPSWDNELEAKAIQAGATDVVALDRITPGDLDRAVHYAIEFTQARNRLQYRLDFDKLVTAISSRFISLGVNELDEGIEDALARVGEFVSVDRSFIFQCEQEDTSFSMTHEWCAEGIESARDYYLENPPRNMKWLEEKLARGEVFAYRDGSELPPEAGGLLQILQNRPIKSFLMVPMRTSTTFIGVLGFSTVDSAREWPDDTVWLIKTLAEVFVNTLQRKQTELALRRSEYRYRTLIEGMGEGILYCDREEIILHINSRMANLVGYTPEEMIGRKADAILMPEGKEHLLRSMTRRRLQGISESYEIEMKRKSGQLFWAEINSTPFRDENGEIVGTLGLITDISERKRAAEALRKSETKYRNLVEASRDLVWTTDAHGVVTFVNQASSPILGYEPDEILHRPLRSFQTVPQAMRDEEILSQLHPADGISHHETEFLHKDGHTVHVVMNLVPIKNEQGETIGATGTASDITEIKKVEEKLREQKAFLRQVIDTNPNLIFAKDRKGRFTLVNQAMADLYLLSPEDLLGRADAELHPHKEDIEQFLADDLEVIKTKRPKFISEGAIRLPSTGEVRVYQTIKKPLITESGEAHQVLGVASDITDRKRAEEESIKLQRQLMHSHKMEAIGQLAAGIAHDLNNALGAVVGHLHLLRMEPQLTGEAKQSVGIALSGCERASGLIEQLLGFSRQGKYDLKKIKATQILSETLEFLSVLLGKNIKIEVDYGEAHWMLDVDPTQIQQALTNLIINAKQAMPKGGKLSFAFSETVVENPARFNPRAKAGRYVVLRVTDTGVGIAAENLDKVFEPFFTTKSEEEGSGLGLAMVYGILQSHGGWIEVESEPDVGTSFRVYLPIASEHLVELQEAGKDSPAKSGCILVIDDEPSLVDLALTFLKRQGFAAHGFTTAQAALEWYREHYLEVDLIVLDMKMPKMDGRACFYELKRHNPEARVVILSGYIQDGAAHEVLENGALRFFQKPLKYPELIDWITANIHSARPALQH